MSLRTTPRHDALTETLSTTYMGIPAKHFLLELHNCSFRDGKEGLTKESSKLRISPALKGLAKNGNPTGDRPLDP